MENITILVVDDHALIRESWCMILNTYPGMTVIASAGSGEEAVELAKELKPTVIVMDINLPGINGIEATQQIHTNSTHSKILAVSMHAQPAYARQMIQKGAMGYVTKNSSSEEMYKAITEIVEGRKYLCEEIKQVLSEQVINNDLPANGINALTKRELEIISLVKKGNSSRQIAEDLQISLKTVEVHRHNTLKKLKLKNSSSLVNFANQHGID